MNEHPEFLEQIKNALSDQRLSARSAALRAGLPVRAIQSVLDGQNPSLTRIAEICYALGIKLCIGESIDESNKPTNFSREGTFIELSGAESRDSPQTPTDEIENRLQALEQRQEKFDRIVDGVNWQAIQNTVVSNDPGNINEPELPGIRYIEVREVTAAAGSGADVLDETVTGYLAFQRTWLDRNGLDATQCTVIGVMGESMEPTLPAGCSILVNHAWKRRHTGRIYVVRTDEGIVVKRAGRSEDGGWLLESDHPAWKSAPWSADTEMIGEVRWMARTLK